MPVLVLIAQEVRIKIKLEKLVVRFVHKDNTRADLVPPPVKELARAVTGALLVLSIRKQKIVVKVTTVPGVRQKNCPLVATWEILL